MDWNETTSTNAEAPPITLDAIKAAKESLENRPPVPVRVEVNEAGLEALKREAVSVGTMAAGGSWFMGLPVCRMAELEVYRGPVARVVDSEGKATMHEFRSGASWVDRGYSPPLMMRSPDELLSNLLHDSAEREANRSLAERAVEDGPCQGRGSES